MKDIVGKFSTESGIYTIRTGQHHEQYGDRSKKPKSKPKRSWSIRKLHKYAGLLTGFWLVMLGLTGFLLDHRDWRFIWQTEIPKWMVPQKTADKASKSSFRLYRMHPTNIGKHIAAGPVGMWWSDNAGNSWKKTVFSETAGSAVLQPPQVLGITDIDTQNQIDVIYIATDDGLWMSYDFGKTVRPAPGAETLRGRYVNAISNGAGFGETILAVDRSELLKYKAQDTSLESVRLMPGTKNAVPEKYTLSRAIHDIHFGRGIVQGIGSLIVNDASAIAVILLVITGTAFWYLPKRWKNIGSDHRKTTHLRKKLTMRLIHVSHGTFIALAAIPLIAYISVTGSLVGHRMDIAKGFLSNQIDRKFLPPLYSQRSWEGEIQSVAGYIGLENSFSIGTRAGVYTTQDNGSSWKLEPIGDTQTGKFAWTLRSNRDGRLYVGGMGSPNYTGSRILGENEGRKFLLTEGAGHMPTDITLMPDGRDVWKSHAGLSVRSKQLSIPEEPVPPKIIEPQPATTGNKTATIKPEQTKTAEAKVETTLAMAEIIPGKKGFNELRLELPYLNNVPLFFILDGLHSGEIIHPQWKWVNDFMTIVLLFLSVTGVVRWYSRRQGPKNPHTA